MPKWAWIAGPAITAACYAVNRGGHGWVAFVAAITLSRLALNMDQRVRREESEEAKWAMAGGMAFVGVIVIAIASAFLHPELQRD